MFQRHKSLPAFGDHGRRNEVGQVCGRRAAPPTVRKDMNLDEAHLADDAARGLEISFRFAWESDNDIRSESRPIEHLTQAATALQKPCAAITPVHERQNPI